MRSVRSLSHRSRTCATALGVVGALVLAGCATNTETTTPAGSTGGSGAAAAVKAVTADSKLAAMVPAAVKIGGKLVVGVDSTYAPNEFKDGQGAVIGFDVDLFDAVAAKLGLKTSYVTADFANIIPGVQQGTYSIGVSSFTDNTTRQAQVDFVDYFTAGSQWAAPVGKTVNPDSACGLTVAVQTGTVQADPDLPARSAACTAAGKPEITVQKYTAQSDATTAVVLGKVAAMAADSPVTAYAVQQTGGKLALAGDVYEAAPYGYAIAKSQTTFRDAVQQALQALIADGTYGSVCGKWGVSAGAITKATVNAGKS